MTYFLIRNIISDMKIKNKSDKACNLCRKILTNKPLTVFSITIFFCILSFILIPNNTKTKFTIVKAHWPAWDYFEQINTKQHLKRDLEATFITKNNYEDALNTFINSDAHIGTLSIYEAIISYEKLNKNVQIILLLDYTVGSDAIISQPNIKHITELKNKKNWGGEKHNITLHIT